MASKPAVSKFEYLTSLEWLTRNMPRDVEDAYHASLQDLHEYGRHVNIGPLLMHLDDVACSYDDGLGSNIAGATDYIDQFFSIDTELENKAQVEREVALKEAAYSVFQRVLYYQDAIRSYEGESQKHFGLGPLGLDYFDGNHSRGWVSRHSIVLPVGLGQPVLSENWDTNHPDQGVQFTLRLTHDRKKTIYWESRWITEEEIPDVVEEVAPYLHDADTFMVLYHLHHGQVEF